MPPHRRHRVLVGALFATALITGLVGMFAVWANRQPLNPENGTEVSSQLLADPEIRDAVSAYLVDELFNSVDIQAQIAARLPDQVDALAVPATAAVRELADRRAPILLARPAVQDAWRSANLRMRTALVRFLEDDNAGGALSSTNGEIVLDLRVLVDRLAAELGLTGQVAAAREKLQSDAGTAAAAAAQQRLGVTLPPEAGRVVIAKVDQIETARNVTSVIRHLSVVMTVLTFGLLALGVWLARGWRREALRTAGWCLLALGLLVVLTRRAVGNRVIEGILPEGDSLLPAAQSAWTITTQMLYEIGVAIGAFGAVLIAAAWLAGRTRPATAIRRALAPALRDHPGGVYGAAAFAFLLLLAWGPIPATRQPVGIVLLAVLLVLGVEALRRQTAREFPDAQSGDTSTRIRGRLSGLRSPKAPA